MRSRLPIILIGALSALLLAALYLFLKVSNGGSTAQNAQLRNYTLSISNPEPGAPFPIFQAIQGDRITFTIRSDRPGQVNVHGYEKHIPVAPGQEATLSFVAQAPGVFPLHLHETADSNISNGAMMHRHLAVLEVKPR